MTAITSTAPRTTVPSTAHVTFFGVLKAEWIKFFSVRSSIWVMAVSVVVMVGFALLMAVGMSFGADVAVQESGEPLPLDSTVGIMVATFGYSIGQIVFVVLGVMRISGEYSTGQIRSTLAAVPTRLPVLAAKALVVGIASFVVGALTTAITILVTTPILEPHGIAIDLSLAQAQRAVLGVPLYLCAMALFSLAVGAMLRHTAAGIAAVVGVIMVLPIIGQIDLAIIRDIAPYLPSTAGELIINGDLLDGPLTPWQGYLVLLGWVAAAMIAAAVLLRGRDA